MAIGAGVQRYGGYGLTFGTSVGPNLGHWLGNVVQLACV